MALKGIDDFKHQKECGGVYVSLFILFLCELPVGHHVPYDLRLVKRALLELFVLKVDDLKEFEDLRLEPFLVDSELLDNFTFDVGKRLVGLDLYEDGVPNREIDGDRNLPLAHQCH